MGEDADTRRPGFVLSSAISCLWGLVPLSSPVGRGKSGAHLHWWCPYLRGAHTSEGDMRNERPT